jgi:hypothetical protein
MAGLSGVIWNAGKHLGQLSNNESGWLLAEEWYWVGEK